MALLGSGQVQTLHNKNNFGMKNPNASASESGIHMGEKKQQTLVLFGNELHQTAPVIAEDNPVM